MIEGHRVDFSLFKQLLRYLAEWKIKMGGALLLIIGARVIDAVIPISLGIMTQEILSGGHESTYFIKEALWLCGLLLLGYFLDVMAVVIKSWVGSKGILKLRKEVFNHIQSLPLKVFDKEPVGKLLTRTMHDVDQINQLFSESLLPLFGSLILFFLILMGMFWLDWRAALIILFLLPLIFIFTNYFRNYQRKGYEKIRTEIQEMNAFVQEHLQGVITIRHFGLHEKEGEKFNVINARLAEGYLETTNNFGFYISGNDFLQSLAFIGAFVILTYQPPFSAGIFFAFSLYVIMIFRPLIDLAERYNGLQSSFAAASRLFDLLKEPIEESSGETLTHIDTLEFRSVWFAYQDEEWVLKDINFKLQPGEKLAVVGQTGSGKTSIISLILRFYAYQKGAILINDKPLEYWSLQSVRRACSLTLQDPVIFTGTVEENVTLFDPSISLKESQKALTYVNFPPKEKMQSSTLSSGEMQLVSLARVAAHPGRFLILDEATANIDPETERIIQEALQKLMKGRGAIVIAHRLSTIRGLDRIMVLAHGKVVEIGTHNELIAKKGAYEKLSRLEYGK